MAKIIENDDYIWEKQLNEIFKNKRKDKIDTFFQAVNLILFFSIKNKDMLELYKILGLENFSKVINFFNGKMIKTTPVSEFKEAMLLSLFYYMRTVEGKSWDCIKKEVPFEVQSIKYGIRMKKLTEFIRSELDGLFKDLEKEE